MRDENIQQAYEVLTINSKKLTGDKAARRDYELRETAARYYRSIMYTAKQEGIQQERLRLGQAMLAKG